jgi:hypothetical protein
MFRPIRSSSDVNIFGEENVVFCCSNVVKYVGLLDAYMCLNWWVVFSLLSNISNNRIQKFPRQITPDDENIGRNM